VAETKSSPLKSTVSIPSSLLQTKKLVDEKLKISSGLEIEKTSEPKKVFKEEESRLVTQSMLDQAIPAIKEYFITSNKNLELAILDQSIRVNQGEIFLEVIGSVQEEIANKMKPEFLDLVRKLTGANQLSVSIQHREELVEERTKIYTSTDKLRFLKDKHPALAELQRNFVLEVDF
jgi:hypothetical protein